MGNSRTNSLTDSGSFLGWVGAARNTPIAPIMMNRLVFQLQFEVISIVRASWSARRNLKIDPDAFNLEGFRGSIRNRQIPEQWVTPFGVLNSVLREAASEEPINFVTIIVVMIGFLVSARSSFATTQGLNQIATPDVQTEGTLALSFDVQDRKIGNPYQVQAEMGLTKCFQIDIFQGFKPNDSVIETEIGVLSKEPYLFSIGFLNWSPHSHVDPQPFAVAGYYFDRHEFVAGATHADFRNEALLGYAYDFNETWRLQIDWQSGSGNASTIGIVWNITRDFQGSSAIYVTNDKPHEVLGYVSFTYTFHVWGGTNKTA
jgi:hypothetical protein